MILFLCKLAHEPVHNFLKKRSKIKIVLKKGELLFIYSLSIIIDIDIDRGIFDTPQTRMVERFLK